MLLIYGPRYLLDNRKSVSNMENPVKEIRADDDLISQIMPWMGMSRRDSSSTR